MMMRLDAPRCTPSSALSSPSSVTRRDSFLSSGPRTPMAASTLSMSSSKMIPAAMLKHWSRLSLLMLPLFMSMMSMSRPYRAARWRTRCVLPVPGGPWKRKPSLRGKPEVSNSEDGVARKASTSS